MPRLGRLLDVGGRGRGRGVGVGGWGRGAGAVFLFVNGRLSFFV